MNKKITSRKIAVTAIYLALIAVLTFTPLGFFPIIPGVIDAAFLFLVVVILAAEFEGFWIGVICSTFFGVCSLINSYIKSGLMAYCFQNPLISVLPRIFIGPAVYLVFNFFRRIFEKNDNKFVKTVLPSALGAAAGVVTNTFLVLGFIAIGYGNDIVGEVTMIKLIFGTILLIPFPAELLACILAVPPVYAAVRKYKKQTPPAAKNDGGGQTPV